MTGDELKRLVESTDQDVSVKDYADCAARLTAAYDEARSQDTANKVSIDQFAHAVLGCLAQGSPLDDHVGALPDELLLVAACAAGSSAAIIEFEKQYFRAIRPALLRMKLSGDVIDEVTQLVRKKLFVANKSGSSPLFGYVGKGDLNHFVRVVATRLAISMLRKKNPTPVEDADELFDHSAPADTPQMRLLKARHSNDFKLAFEQATVQLDAQQRNILRMSFVDKLSIDEIGSCYSIHRATAARRLARARARLAELTREQLRERLTLGEGEFTSIVRLVHSQLDLSITRVLGE